MITWPIAIVLLGIFATFCFALWVGFRREMEKEHHRFQERAFSLEEKKFDVWKTANLAQTAQTGGKAERIVQQHLRGGLASAGSASEIEPDGGKVVSMFGRRPPEPSPDKLAKMVELLEKAKEMPEEEARAFLAEHGVEDVAFFRKDDDDDPPTIGPVIG